VFPQEQVTVVSTYLGWMSGFTFSPASGGRRVAIAGLHRGLAVVA